jgi:hypothetical protein
MSTTCTTCIISHDPKPQSPHLALRLRRARHLRPVKQ